MDQSLLGDGDFIEIWNGRGRPDVLTLTITVTSGRWYHFRHRSFNYNGVSQYSDVFSTLSCVSPAQPGKPQWVSSTTSSITFIWDNPIDDGGCPIKEYQVYRDNGNGYGDQVINQIHAADLAGKPQVNGLIASQLPGGSLGKEFVFKIRVVTDYTILALPTGGVDGPVSEPFLLAGVPDKPTSAPTRNAATTNTQLVIDIAAVANFNGAAVKSYHIEIDNGMGGSFSELQGLTTNSLALQATKSMGVY